MLLNLESMGNAYNISTNNVFSEYNDYSNCFATKRPTCQTKGILPFATYQLPVACLQDKSKQQASYSANAVRISVFYRHEQQKKRKNYVN